MGGFKMQTKRTLPAEGYFQKKIYEITLEMLPVGTEVYNQLECCKYTVTEGNRFILVGTRGERWTTSFKNIAKTYRFSSGKPITAETIQDYFVNKGKKSMKITTLPNNTLYYGKQVPLGQQFQVQTSWALLNGNLPIDPNTGKKIEHGTGDYQLFNADPVTGTVDFNHSWIVNGAVMPDTYKSVRR